MATRLTTLDLQSAAIDITLGVFTTRWQDLLRLLFGDVAAVSGLPAVIHRDSHTALNALGLGPSDEGYVAFETTYGHLLRWAGTAWEFAPGDPGNGYFEDFAIAPQSVGWKLCDGSATDYLTLGATLTVTAITPPNLSGTAAYRKSAAAYDGTLVAASGSTTAVGGHTHTVLFGSGGPNDTLAVQSGLGAVVASESHAHTITGTSSSSGGHSHDAGSIDMAHVNVLPYFRR